MNPEVFWIVKVCNNGPSNATNVTLTETLPTGLEFTKAEATEGTFNRNTLTWSMGDLASGECKQIKFYAEINGTTGKIRVTSTTTCDQTELILANNSIKHSVYHKTYNPC